MDLGVGLEAPAVALRLMDGRTVGIPEVGRPQVLFFFKVDCPTCPLAAPSVEVLSLDLAGRASVLCVSQDEPGATADWARAQGLTADVTCEGEGFPASAAFGLVTVPTLVLIDAAGRIARVEEGWSRDGANELARQAAALCGVPARTVAPQGDGRPAFRPG